MCVPVPVCVCVCVCRYLLPTAVDTYCSCVTVFMHKFICMCSSVSTHREMTYFCGEGAVCIMSVSLCIQGLGEAPVCVCVSLCPVCRSVWEPQGCSALCSESLIHTYTAPPGGHCWNAATNKTTKTVMLKIMSNSREGFWLCAGQASRMVLEKGGVL